MQDYRATSYRARAKAEFARKTGFSYFQSDTAQSAGLTGAAAGDVVVSEGRRIDKTANTISFSSGGGGSNPSSTIVVEQTTPSNGLTGLQLANAEYIFQGKANVPVSGGVAAKLAREGSYGQPMSIREDYARRVAIERNPYKAKVNDTPNYRRQSRESFGGYVVEEQTAPRTTQVGQQTTESQPMMFKTDFFKTPKYGGEIGLVKPSPKDLRPATVRFDYAIRQRYSEYELKTQRSGNELLTLTMLPTRFVIGAVKGGKNLITGSYEIYQSAPKGKELFNPIKVASFVSDTGLSVSEGTIDYVGRTAGSLVRGDFGSFSEYAGEGYFQGKFGEKVYVGGKKLVKGAFVDFGKGVKFEEVVYRQTPKAAPENPAFVRTWDELGIRDINVRNIRDERFTVIPTEYTQLAKDIEFVKGTDLDAGAGETLPGTYLKASQPTTAAERAFYKQYANRPKELQTTLVSKEKQTIFSLPYRSPSEVLELQKGSKQLTFQDFGGSVSRSNKFGRDFFETPEFREKYILEQAKKGGMGKTKPFIPLLSKNRLASFSDIPTDLIDIKPKSLAEASNIRGRIKNIFGENKIEPQISESVNTFRSKGYLTVQSGFLLDSLGKQFIEFRQPGVLSSKTLKKLKEKFPELEIEDFSKGGYPISKEGYKMSYSESQYLSFGEGKSLSEIRTFSNDIADFVPTNKNVQSLFGNKRGQSQVNVFETIPTFSNIIKSKYKAFRESGAIGSDFGFVSRINTVEPGLQVFKYYIVDETLPEPTQYYSYEAPKLGESPFKAIGQVSGRSGALSSNRFAKLGSVNLSRFSTSQAVYSRQASFSRVSSVTGLGLGVNQVQTQSQAQVSQQVQLQQLLQVQKLKLKTNYNLKLNLKEPPRSPPVKFKFGGNGKGVFVVFGRRQGKFLKVGESKDLFKAFKLGKKFVGSTAAASFKVVKGKTIIKPKGLSGDYYVNEGVVIEKPSFRIKSSGELREITFKGIAAQRKKGRRGLF